MKVSIARGMLGVRGTTGFELAIHTGSTIHAKLTERERLDLGITPGLVRLSIGLEKADDIIRDLTRALEPLVRGARE